MGREREGGEGEIEGGERKSKSGMLVLSVSFSVA